MLYGPYATPSTNLETWTFKDFREHGERISTFPKVLKCPRNHNFETKRFKKFICHKRASSGFFSKKIPPKPKKGSNLFFQVQIVSLT